MRAAAPPKILKHRQGRQLGEPPWSLFRIFNRAEGGGGDVDFRRILVAIHVGSGIGCDRIGIDRVRHSLSS